MTKRAKKRLALLIGLVVLLVGGYVAQREFRRAQRQAMILEKKESGVAARARGDHHTAVNDLAFYLQGTDAGVEIDPELWLEWIDSRRKLPEENSKHLFTAIVGAKQAVIAMPGDRRPLEQLLDLYRQVGQITERLDTADRLLAIDPAHADALMARAISLWQLGRNDEAMAAARRYTDASPDDVNAHIVVIQLMARQGAKINDVVAYCKALNERSPDNARFRLLTAEILGRSGDEAGARAAVQAAEKLTRDDPDAVRELLHVQDLLGLAADADRTLETRLTASNNPDLLAIAAERAWKAGAADLARERLARITIPEKDASDSVLGWKLLIEAGDQPIPDVDPPALAELRVRTTPDAAVWTATLDGLRAISRQRWSDARARLATAVSADAGAEIASYYLGQCELALGEPQRAVDRWRAVAEREPRWVKLSADLAGMLLSQGRVQEAHAYALRAMTSSAVQGQVAPILARTATALLETGEAEPGQRKAAIEFLEACVKQAPAAGEFWALLSRAYAQGGQHAEARAAAQNIIDRQLKISADSVRILAALSKRLSWGIEPMLEQLAQTAGADDPSVLFAAAMEAASAGRPQEGEALLRQAAESRTGPDKSLFELRLAAFLDLQGDPRAKDILVRLAEQNPTEAAFQIGLLQSRSAWTDQSAITGAIGRLRRLAGDSSTAWRIFEARRLLAFDPSEKNAAEVESNLLEIMNADPRAVLPRELAAEAALIGGARASAARYLTEALAADPDATRIYPRLIVLLQQLGEPDRAARTLRDFAEKTNVTDDLRRIRAQLAMSLSQLDVAKADLEHLAAKNDLAARISLARLAVQEGDPKAAEAAFAQLTSGASPDPQALVAAADFYAGAGRLAEGRALLERVPDEPRGRRSALLAGYLERHGSSTEAEKLYTAAAEANPQNPSAWNELAQFHVRRRQIEQAERALQRGLAVNAKDQGLLATAQAIDLVKGKQLDPAQSAEVVARLGGVDQTAVQKVLAALQERERKPADLSGHILRLEGVMKDHPGFTPAAQLLVQALLEAGQGERAVTVARTSMTALPADPRPARLLTTTLATLDRNDEAIAAAREWRSRTLDNTFEPDVMLAQLLLAAGKPADAVKALAPHAQRIAGQADDAPQRVELYATALAASGRADDAAKALENRHTTSPEWAMRTLRIGSALGSAADARAWIARYEPGLPSTPVYQLPLGQAWYDVGVRHTAPDALRKSIDVLRPAIDDPNVGAVAAAMTGAAHEQLKQLPEAEAMYRLALKKNPDQAPVLNNLAYLLASAPAPSDEALELATRAVTLAPGVPNFLDTKAVCLEKLGRFADAEQAYREALKFDPASLGLQIGAAYTLWKQGKNDLASQTFERVTLAVQGGRELPPTSRQRFDELSAAFATAKRPTP